MAKARAKATVIFVHLRGDEDSDFTIDKPTFASWHYRAFSFASWLESSPSQQWALLSHFNCFSAPGKLLEYTAAHFLLGTRGICRCLSMCSKPTSKIINLNSTVTGASNSLNCVRRLIYQLPKARLRPRLPLFNFKRYLKPFDHRKCLW